jgi:hypothetical protein
MLSDLLKLHNFDLAHDVISLSSHLKYLIVNQNICELCNLNKILTALIFLNVENCFFFPVNLKREETESVILAYHKKVV